MTKTTMSSSSYSRGQCR